MVVETTEWRAESLRASAFYAANEAVSDAAQVWEVVMGRAPDRVSSRPREGIQTAEGSIQGDALVVSSQAGRIDLNIRPMPPAPNVRIDGFVTLGLFSEMLPRFLESTKEWLRESPLSTRLAFGAALLKETESISTGNEEINRLLPGVQIDAKGSSDFFYQINRRRRSLSTSGVLVNRLSKWSVMQGGSVDLVAGGGLGIQVSSGREFYGCRLELDVNTVGPRNHPIPKAKITDLFEELARLGKEIADKGDIS
jgi:hypothetical protein